MFILWWIIVGIIAGWITGKLMSGGGYGVFMDMVIGIVGAVIGGSSCDRSATRDRVACSTLSLSPF